MVAYRAPESDRTLAELQAKVTSSGGTFDLAALTDGDLAKSTLLPAAPVDEKAWIQFEFPRPQTVHGLTIVTMDSADRRERSAGNQELESSDDGREFRTVVAIPAGARTIAFPAVTAKFFRVSIPHPGAARPRRVAAPRRAPQAQPAAPAGTPNRRTRPPHLGNRQPVPGEGRLLGCDRPLRHGHAPAPAADAIRKADVIDLTSKMRADGTLDWTPPAGRWVVLRIGYSLTGARNSPASPEATGLEVDKLSRAHVKAYFDNYLGQYKDTVGALMGKRGLQYVITDSWEAGVANWTDDMIAEFAKRRGYDMRPWLPVLAGRVVESAEASDRFLWDFRKTIAT